jgi:hypothetical protein
MFTHQAGQMWTLDNGGQAGTFVHQIVWEHSDTNTSLVWFGTNPTNWNDMSARSYEKMIRRDDGWIVYDGTWAASHGKYLQQRAKKVIFYWNPGTSNEQAIDLTYLFIDGPQPYALEEVPNVKYAFKVEGEVIDSSTGLKVLDFTDYQIWHPPAQRETVFQGNKFTIFNEEWYSQIWPTGDPRGTESVHRDHTIAQDVGYGARMHDYANGGWLAGTKYIWNW